MKIKSSSSSAFRRSAKFLALLMLVSTLSVHPDAAGHTTMAQVLQGRLQS